MDTQNTKYFLIRFEERNGEQEYTIPYLVASDEDIDTVADEIASTWYGIKGKYIKDYECWYFFGGAIAVSIDSVLEMPEEHYNILKIYL